MTEPQSDTGRERAETSVPILDVASDGRIIWPWSRQYGESRQAFEAFETYLATEVRGVRSIREAARQLGKSRQMLERWSAKWRWVERCEKYDCALHRLRVAGTVAEAREQARELARANESVRYIAVRGAHAELDRLMPLRDRLLFAALAMPFDALVEVVDAEGVLLPEGLGATGTESAPMEQDVLSRGWAQGWAEPRHAMPQGG